MSWRAQGARPSISWGPDFEKQWTSPCLCDSLAAVVCMRQSVRPGLPIWMAWGDWGPLGLDAWLPQGWQLGRIWEPGPKGAANWDLPPLSQDWDLGGLKLCLGTLPFLVRTENNIHLVEIFRNIVTWPWPDLENKGSDTQKSVTANHAHPSPFPFKGTCWQLSVTLGF